MALNLSPSPISLAGTTTGQSIQIELGGNGSSIQTLNDTDVRLLAEKTGAGSMIQMPTDFWGKSRVTQITITSNQNQLNLRNYILANSAWNQTTGVIVTLAVGYWIYSTDPLLPAMTIDGSFPAGIEFINNGYVGGCGGDGYPVYLATGDTRPARRPNGGTAIKIGAGTYGGTGIKITNNNYIAGGGGGGGAALYWTDICGGGGGAGGGWGGDSGTQRQGRTYKDTVHIADPSLTPLATLGSYSAGGGGTIHSEYVTFL